MLIQSNGKIVLTGWSQGSSFNSDFIAVRLHADGSLDSSFGNQGRAIVPFDFGGALRDEANSAVLQSDGKIVMVGSVEWPDYNFDFGVVRLLPDGTPDWSFANGGKITVTFDRGGSLQDYGEALMIDASGRIVVAGRAAGASLLEHDFAVARLLANGSLDLSFGTNGKTTIGIDYGLGIDQAFAVARAPLGQIVIAGTTFYSSTDTDFAAVRLHSDGTVDTQFGINGRARVLFDVGGDKADAAYAMAIGIDGGIVMAGPVDTLWDIHLIGVAKLQGAPWMTLSP